MAIPVLLHGAYDFIAASGYVHYAWGFVVFVGCLFFAAFRLVRNMSRNDQYIENRTSRFY